MKGPFIKSKQSTSKMMLLVIISLIPIIVFTIYKNGYLPYTIDHNFITLIYPLLFILVGTISTFVFELLYALLFLRKKYSLKDFIKTSYSFMPGLFIALVLPLNTPIYVLIIGCFVGSIIAKLLFGGFGKNIFNPALFGVLFIMICFGTNNYLNKYELDGVSSSTPLTNYALLSETNAIINSETLYTPYGGFINYFIGLHPGAVGETSALLCILALLFLIITKTIKWRIPISYISTVFIMTLIISLISGYSLSFALFSIISGGLLFGATFMATDPVTSPVTAKGQVLYGILLGILTTIVRFLLPYPEGVLISILTMNIFVIIIDNFSVYTNKNIRWYILTIILVIILMSGISYYIGNNNKKVDTGKDENYTIIERVLVNNQVKYVVSERHQYGTLKANIVIENGNIISINIVSPIDSYTNQIETQDYINKIINNQDTINSLDAVSGATFTSNALKKIVVNTLEDYKAGDFKQVEPIKDYEIIDTKIDENIVTYSVKQKGYINDITLDITFTDDKITKIEIVNYDEHEYINVINDNNYLDLLITNQSNIDGLDTISGATYTSSYLKDLIENIIKEHNHAS